MIGDGDSSVYVKVKESVPYGRNVIKKECANHVVKCYTMTLFKVQLGLKNRKKLLTNKTILKLKYMGRRTIANNYKMGFNVDTLREDLKNGPRHIFGDHRMCKDYYCEIDKNEPVIPLSIEIQNVIERVEDVLKLLIRKAPQLFTNDTSNVTENFMSLVAKFTGGKQISRGKKRIIYVQNIWSRLRFSIWTPMDTQDLEENVFSENNFSLAHNLKKSYGLLPVGEAKSPGVPVKGIG